MSFGKSKDISRNINGPRASLSVPENTLLVEVLKQDLEETSTSAGSSARCSLTLCPCVNRALEPDCSQVQGISLSAPLQHHQRTSGCLTTPQWAEHLALNIVFPGMTLFLVQKVHILLFVRISGISIISSEWGSHGQGEDHSIELQAAATTSRM